MPAGMQAWDAQGNMIVDLTSRLARVGDSFAINDGDSGQITVPGSGEIFYMFQPSNLWGFINGDFARPIFNISGRTISWYYSAPATNNSSKIRGILFYGVK